MEDLLADLQYEDPRVRTIVLVKLCQKQASDWEREYEKRVDACLEAKLMFNKSVELLERAERAFVLARKDHGTELRESDRREFRLEDNLGQFSEAYSKAYR